MCGIAGIVKSNRDIDLKIVMQSMLDAIIHRGPDGEGLLIFDSLALGHRRLSILDLSTNASQPMNYMAKYEIVFNGEIYNYIEIKNVLVEKGYAFKSQSDTEVIMASYDYWGNECVNQFNGMWSFAIYDIEKNILFCSRDRFGIKPFYYTQHNGGFYFSSEIKQLLIAGVPARVNYQIMMDYIVMGMEEHTENTFFDSIHKLPASHSMVFDLSTHTFEIFRYYTLEVKKEYLSLSKKESLELFEKEMLRSVKYRLRSDVKVGTCLSGGLDSSYVASVASKVYGLNTNEQLVAITAKSIDEKKDESHYAQKVVEACNLSWHVVEPSTSDFKNDLFDIVKVQEEPFGSPSIFMQYYVFKEAKKIGCAVLLDGQGGDETLMGYENYYTSYVLSKSLLKKPYAIFNASRNSKLGLLKTIKYCFYFGNTKIRINHLKKRIPFIRKEAIDRVDFSILHELTKATNNSQLLQVLEIAKTKLPHLLKYEDRNSMINSIETRLPFLDYKLVELMISLPFNHKIYKGWTKYILREAVSKNLPDSIAWRKNKYGFEAPEEIWLNDKDFIMNEISQSKLLKNVITNSYSFENKRMTWRLLNIAIWEKCYKVNL
ncbi:MAG: asparagine synthase (glutamine-hydrolyzing) [Bacteroidales bacterium]|nr:asparagine synthase (glutamine-hydrolyzing) [Bacteroidales bacterium]MDY0216006.1 asparagine synthase (glutamine-hydrolyzing) [Bacteroidales bacterium]